MSTAKTLLTTADLACRWQRPPQWIRMQAKAGKIPALRVGDQWRFDPDDIAAFEQRHKTKTPPESAAATDPETSTPTRDPLSMTPLSAARQRGRGMRRPHREAAAR